MSDLQNQQPEELETVDEEDDEVVENYLEVDKADIIPTAKEVREKEKAERKRTPREPTEKQLIARKNASERLSRIHKQKEEERQRVKLEEEKRIIDELKTKWLKEYEKEKKATAKQEPTEKVRLPATQRLRAVKPKSKPKPKPTEETETEEDEEEETELEDKPFLKRVHQRKRLPKSAKRYVESDTEADSTDTEAIKKKIEKVKQIDSIIQPRVENPYVRLLQQYYK